MRIRLWPSPSFVADLCIPFHIDQNILGIWDTLLHYKRQSGKLIHETRDEEIYMHSKALAFHAQYHLPLLVSQKWVLTNILLLTRLKKSKAYEITKPWPLMEYAWVWGEMIVLLTRRIKFVIISNSLEKFIHIRCGGFVF